jgi:lipopolysaccharide biosynthesis protein
MNDIDLRAIAFFLPQYHPVPENDLWWGKGFTEWTNVAKSTPCFPGHYQPHLPKDLGFYDLRLPEVREAQAKLASEYGVHGFCYYHYWFNGRRILERPVNEIVQSGSPNFPFCLCWANENWTRRWDGQDQEVLLRQEYHQEDDLQHIRSLIHVFKDPRYILVEGKPLFLVYKLSALPDAEKTLEIWRAEALRAGLKGLFICNVESSRTEHGLASKKQIDAAVEFAPDWTLLPPPLGRTRKEKLSQRLSNFGRLNCAFRENYIADYSQLVENMCNKPDVDYPRIPCVTPMWDNSARRKTNAMILRGSTPDLYRDWLRNRVQHVKQNPSCRNLIFINAWNEWAEGNHLEPCQKWGSAYLEVTKQALNS